MRIPVYRLLGSKLMPLKKYHDIVRLRDRTESRPPAPMFYYMYGGSHDEWTGHTIENRSIEAKHLCISMKAMAAKAYEL
jgi:hypothetical protein